MLVIRHTLSVEILRFLDGILLIFQSRAINIVERQIV